MAHNFFEGIDWIFDATGNTALASHAFVSFSGNNGNAGTDPNNPKLTVKNACEASGQSNVIVGDGYYAETGINGGSQTIKGDGRVIIKGDGVTNLFSVGRRDVYNVELIDFDQASSVGGVNLKLYDCLIKDCNLTMQSNASSNATLERCDVINVSVNMTNTAGLHSVMKFCTFNNVSFTQTSNAYIEEFESNHVSSNCTFNVPNNESLFASGASRSNINSAINSYADLDAAVTALGGFTGCFDSDPLFEGLLTRREKIIPTNSPLFRSGENGYNIGWVKNGNLQNSTSTELGVSPEDEGNTEWVNDELRVVSPNVSAVITSSVIDLGQGFISPKFVFNAFLDMLNHTPDFDNTLVNPNLITVEIDWAGRDGVFNGSYEVFRDNYLMVYDSANDKYPGESGFNPNTASNLEVRYVKARITLRNDRVAA